MHQDDVIAHVATAQRCNTPAMTTDPCGPLSAAEVQALHRRVLAARDLDVDPDPTDLATAHQLNADELAQFDRTSSEEALKFH